MSEDRTEARFSELDAMGAEYAQAKALADHLAEFRKSKKSLLMQDAEKRGFNTAALQEREAYAHPEYIKLLESLHAANEQAEALKWKLRAFEMRFDYWRSRQATARAEMGLR